MSKSREAVPLPLSADEIARHPGLHGSIRQQSQQLLQAYDDNPRLAAVFGTQHRWLMAQAALAIAFRAAAAGKPGVNGARILDLITEHGVASRNTANAFLQEMVYYGWARIVPGAADRRTRPIEPTEASVAGIHGWIGIHLASLDRLDDGGRLQTYLAAPGALTTLQPLIADGLLSSGPVREPERTFSLFTWLNQGGQLMDWLISGIDEPDPDVERVPTAVASIAVMAERLMLSRSHLSRKLKAAEAMGSIGWQGKRGQSLMWVSAGFRREYAMAQAVKLAIVDAAFVSCFPQRPAEMPAMQGAPIDGSLPEAA